MENCSIIFSKNRIAMKRLLINDELREIAKDYKKSMAKKFRAKPVDKLETLKGKLDATNDADEIAYIQHIIDNYDEIIMLDPDQFDKYQEDYFDKGNINKTIVKKVVNKNTKEEKEHEMKLHEAIVECMRYTDVRDKIYPELFYRLNLRTCPYCNAQYLVTIERKTGLKGTYQLDHGYPKSKYPWLCTTFFNLVPSCSSCNQAKGNDDKVDYKFYTSNPKELYPFSFVLNKASIIRYLLYQDEKVLSVELKPMEVRLAGYEKAFGINSLYSSFNDVIEEIVWKSRIYNDSFKKNIKASLGRSFPYSGDFARFITGNYTDRKDILKRPLALLVGDISRQLRVIF